MFVASAAVTMSRARNTATAEDILKRLKTEVSCLDPEVYNQLDHDSLCESNEMFLHAMFRCTARPTNAILEKACLQNFPHASPGEIDKFVKAIQTCVKQTHQTQSQTCFEWQEYVSCYEEIEQKHSFYRPGLEWG